MVLPDVCGEFVAVEGWVPWWFVLAGTLILLVGSTLNMALRIPSRARFADRFERAGRREAFGAFLMRRAPYTLATAIVRSVAGLALVPFFYFTDGLFTWWHAYLAALVVVLVFGVAIPTAIAKYGRPDVGGSESGSSRGVPLALLPRDVRAWAL